MSRDYKSNKTKSKKNGGPLFIGFLAGLLLGFMIAAGAAWRINKIPSPFVSKNGAAEPAVLSGLAPETKNKAADKSKTRFDFYKILPGTEELVTDQKLKQSTVRSPNNTYILQAGAFRNEADADNLKARLALIGAEATIRTIILPDKGVWHRVRLGPYTNAPDLDRMRKTLAKNNIKTTLFKMRRNSD